MDGLLRPRGIVVVGASERSAYANSVVDNLLAGGVPSTRLHYVNPRRAEFRGAPCHPSVLDIDAPIDLAVVVTAAARVPAVIEECGRAGVSAAVILAGGFAEAGPEGGERQRKLAAAAADGGVSLLGPNSLGFVSRGTNVAAWGGRLPTGFRRGGMSAVFQSSGMLNLYLQYATENRVGFDLAVSTGNQAGLDLGDCLLAAVDSDDTKFLAVHIESIISPDKVVRALWHAAEAGKPVVVLRVGRSARGRRNVTAHTGALAPDDTAWDAVLRQFGTIRVDDVEEMLQACVLLAAGVDRGMSTGPAGAGIGFVTISGGDCTLVSDLAERVGAVLPDVSPDDQVALESALGRTGLIGNPLDVGTAPREDPDGFRAAARVLAGSAMVDVVAARLYLPEGAPEAARENYRLLREEVERAGKRLVALSRTAEEALPEWGEFFASQDVPLLKGYTGGLRALARVGEARRRATGDSVRSLREVPALRPVEPAARQAREPSTWDAAATAALLREYGVTTPPSELVGSVADARSAAHRLGYPVVVKADNAVIAHKTEAGAVVVGVADDDALTAAWHRVAGAVAAAGARGGPAVVVQKMMPSAVAEVLIGLKALDRVGSLIVVAAGGVFTELLSDVTMRLCPVDPAGAREMLEELAVGRVLSGWRGGPAGDVDALVTMISQVSRLGNDRWGEIRELDLNPVLVLPHGQGAVPVDALVVTG